MFTLPHVTVTTTVSDTEPTCMLTVTVTVMIQEAHHVEAVTASILMITAMIVMITAEDWYTWTVEVMYTLPHVTVTTTVSDAEAICMLTVKVTVMIHQASEYTAHATDTDTEVHADQ